MSLESLVDQQVGGEACVSKLLYFIRNENFSRSCASRGTVGFPAFVGSDLVPFGVALVKFSLISGLVPAM